MRAKSAVLTVLALAVAAASASPVEAGRRNRALAEKGEKTLAAGMETIRTAEGIPIPAHPSLLEFAPLSYEAPNRMDSRHEIADGVVAYVVEDHDLPLVNVSITARGGAYIDPDGLEGLAGFTANLMRTGGAGDMDAETFDEEIDFLAANIGISGGDTESTASLNVLAKDLDAGLDLLFAALKEPRFEQERLDLRRKQVKQGLERRNDATPGIERREWIRLGYGDDHFESKGSTWSSVDAIDRDALKEMHRKIWHPGNFIVAVSGDVETDAVLANIEARLEDWWDGPLSPDVPAPDHEPPAGVFVVNKDDVNQTRVSVGHLASRWDDPQWAELSIMNEVLGGGGFTSRITRRVRSDEGLAYSAGSGWGFGRDYPRTFRALFQSRNEAVPRGLALVIEELERIRTEPITDEELATAKSSFIETFPRRFSSASAKVGVFVDDELTGRPADWWAKYRPAIRAVTAADVMKAASENLHPDRATILVVGKIDEVMAGDPDHPDYQLVDFAGERGVLEIPLPDPKSLQYPHEPRPIATPKADKASVAGAEG